MGENFCGYPANVKSYQKYFHMIIYFSTNGVRSATLPRPILDDRDEMRKERERERKREIDNNFIRQGKGRMAQQQFHTTFFTI